MAKQKRKQQPASPPRTFAELFDEVLRPEGDPHCMGCAMEATEADIERAAHDVTDLAAQYGIALTEGIAVALLTVWRFGWQQGAHTGLRSAVQNGIGITPAERDHGGH